MDNAQKEKIKSIFLLLGIAALTLSIGFLPAGWFGIDTATPRYKVLDLSRPASIEDLATDTNSDGEISWQELVNQTWGNSSETAGATELDEATIAQLNDPNNITTSFSKNVYLTSAYLKQYGEGDASTQQDVIEKLIDEEAVKLIPTLYTYNDLTIQQSVSSSTIKSYGNAMGAIVSAGMNTGLGITDLQILKKYVDDTTDTASLAVLRERVETAETLLASIKELRIPSSAAPYHLLMLNSVQAYTSMMKNISTIDSDPLRASIAFQGYQEITGTMIRDIAALSNYFSAEGVVFAEKDTGYIFSPSYTIKN